MFFETYADSICASGHAVVEHVAEPGLIDGEQSDDQCRRPAGTSSSAGLLPADGTHGRSAIAGTGRIDPLLREWVRSSHPVTSGGAQRAVLAACWDAALAGSLVQALDECSVERRRSYLVHVRGDLEGDLRGARREAALGGLAHLWEGYLRHGRRQLASPGQRVVLAPQFAAGFGIADLVAGRSLIEVKTVLEPAEHFGHWLNQLLGYVLLDWFNALCLDTVALYLSWQALLTAAPIASVFAVASPGPTPYLEDLRAGFRQAIQADLDQTHQAQLHRRYPTPLMPASAGQPNPGMPARRFVAAAWCNGEGDMSAMRAVRGKTGGS